MTDLTIPLTALSLGSAGFAAFDLHRREMRDVLGAVGFFVLGLVLGTIVQLFFPGGFLFGSIGGAALGMTRLEEIRQARRLTLEKELEVTGGRAERMVLLHDRLDRLRPTASRMTRFLGIVSGGCFAVIAAGLLLGGLLYQSGGFLFLGSIAALLPAAGWASYSVRGEEVGLLRKGLLACEDEAAGLVPTKGGAM
jgi:hypothetical protein